MYEVCDRIIMQKGQIIKGEKLARRQEQKEEKKKKGVEIANTVAENYAEQWDRGKTDRRANANGSTSGERVKHSLIRSRGTENALDRAERRRREDAIQGQRQRRVPRKRRR